MVSVFDRTGRLYGFLYGDLEGRYIFRKGRMEYSFETDRFVLIDNQGNRVFGSDLGEEVERWLIRNEWAGTSR